MFTILVVDDSGTERDIIRDALGDYTVLSACNGREALELLEQDNAIDMIILDLNMPDMNGFQVLETLQGNEKLKDIRTIILTNHDELENEVRGLNLGAVDFISKPFQKESLRARIEVHKTLLGIKKILEQKLFEQGNTLEAILDQVPIGIMISYGAEAVDTGWDEYVSSNPAFTINPAYEKIVGRSKEELLKIGWAAVTHPDDVEKDLACYQRMLAGEIDGYEMEKRYIRPDGMVIWVHLTVAKLLLSGSEQLNHFALIRDITESKMMTEKLMESERSQAVLLSNLQGMAYRCSYDHDWTMHYVSSGCLELTGYSPDDLINNQLIAFNELIAPEYRDMIRKSLERNLPKRLPFRYEYELMTAKGERKWVLEIGQGVYNDREEVEALEGIIIDISDRKEMEIKLKNYSERDEWTGLYNRRFLDVILNNDLQDGFRENHALVSVNINSMYSLSIRYGFHYSQNLILKVAEKLKTFCHSQCLLFNTHDYNFVFYYKGYQSHAELRQFCENIAGFLTEILSPERISAGIGVVEITEQTGQNIEQLQKTLLITSEEAISPRDEQTHITFFSKELEEKITRMEIIQNELAEISAGRQEERLFLQYQPILSLHDNQIHGFEALARVRSNQLGMVPPLEFIPIIEEAKLIIPIGYMIIRKACDFLRLLESSGFFGISVSINISAIQLLSQGFVENLIEMIRQAGTSPKQIELELTETVFASRLDELNRLLGQLKHEGIECSIDDFGTGYSSLARERDLQVSCLKIDKSFIDRLMNLNEEETITSDIISMAHKLGHLTVAEGVEHQQQMDYLRNNGCDKIQGYLISRPLDEKAAIEFLAKYNHPDDKTGEIV